jgi:hypothetical protein
MWFDEGAMQSDKDGGDGGPKHFCACSCFGCIQRCNAGTGDGGGGS